jgi:hypothetical protein
MGEDVILKCLVIAMTHLCIAIFVYGMIIDTRKSKKFRGNHTVMLLFEYECYLYHQGLKQHLAKRYKELLKPQSINQCHNTVLSLHVIFYHRVVPKFCVLIS